MRRFLALTAAVAAAVASAGSAAAQQGDDTVRVIHVVIDGLHPSQVGADTPVLADLKANGIWYEQARSVMASETLPNHVAMATGAYPERNGIPANVGRAEVGDTELADPDLRIPALRQATSLTTAIETTCPDLRTVTVFSKAYVHGTFAEDGADADFPQPMFNIPESDHALDTTTVGYLNQQLVTEDPPDYLFANLGDVDRSGHIDASGFLGFPGFQRAAIQQTDTLLGTVVENLKQQGLWEDTVLVVNSDHSMDWSNVADTSTAIDLIGALEADPRTQGRFFTAEEGGAGSIYLLDPAAPDADAVLAAAREVVVGLDGVAEALYREPNPLDPGHDLDTVHPDWHAATPRIGELFVHAVAGYNVGTNPTRRVPGNHGHGVTRHITMLITGGWDGLAAPTSIAPSDPDAVDVVDDTASLPEQAEQVDLAPTFGWLMGIPEPEPGQWQGRVLSEAFTRQPAPACVTTAGGPPAPTDDPSGADEDPAGGGPMPATGGGAAMPALGLLGLGAWLRRWT